MLLRALLILSIYVIIVAIIYILEPDMMFDIDGSLRDIGFTEDNKSILSLYIVAPVLAILLYIVCFVLWKLF